MFKPNHYYRVMHRDDCVIQALSCISNSLWMIKIIKIYNKKESMYSEGLVIEWYEDWCTSIKEINDDDELLAMVL